MANIRAPPVYFCEASVMQYAARSLLTAATLTTAGALALTTLTFTPSVVHTPNVSAMPLSSQTVQLADAWSDLATNTLESVVFLASMTLGEQGYDLPSPTLPLAPIATQFVLNQLIYLGQLVTGHGGQIPGEIATHLTNVGKVLSKDLPQIPPLIRAQLQTPLIAVQTAVTSVISSTNPLIGLLEAPAVFLDYALNNQTGLLGKYGPIGVPIIIRNELAVAIDPPLPGWLAHLLQPAKPGTPTGLTHTATSNRSKSKAPVVTFNSAKSGHPSVGGARNRKHS